ncbi:hypothetical protein V8B97DRAFT_12647 [Scleroderma yunnanense]
MKKSSWTSSCTASIIGSLCKRHFPVFKGSKLQWKITIFISLPPPRANHFIDVVPGVLAMATSNGSPIPVDQLPAYYETISGVQMTQQVHVAISVVLLYEYFLTLDQEITLIWRQRWRPSSVLYIFVRYFGTFYNLASTVLIFLPQSVAVSFE